MDSRTLVKNLSHDLPHIDLSLLENRYEKFNKISEERNFYQQLSEICAYNTIIHPEWSLLAGRIKTKELKLNTGKTFSETTEKAKILLNQEYYEFVKEHKKELDDIVIEDRDDSFDWFGICTALKSYLLKLDGKTIESIQHMFLRVATWLHKPNLSKIKSMYDDLSLKNYMHATPTLFNSGLRRPQLASCFLMTVQDSLGSISKSWYDCAMISKTSGGIGIDISDIRHSEIGHANKSSGVVPMLKVHNSILQYVDQGGKRKGSAAIYLPAYHVDIFEFLELRKNTGSDSVRARDLFYAMWISDLFMKRVENDELWSLFCPNIANGLNDVWGHEFEELYTKYEKEGKYDKQVPARELWQAIYLTQIETGMPYILFKDAANRKSNQKNLGTIRCSNLCAEILEYTSKDEIASCNLANIVLNSCVKSIMTNKGKKSIYDFVKLERLARELVRNLNIVIDINHYVEGVPQIKYANLKNRPIGIGVQGLADTFAMMDYEWDSVEAKELNLKIFETIYYGAITESIKISHERKLDKEKRLRTLKAEWKNLVDSCLSDELTEKHKQIVEEIKKVESIVTTYDSFEGSPTSKGFLQFDLWEAERIQKEMNLDSIEDMTIDFVKENSHYEYLWGRYDWDRVRGDLQKIGLRNSLLVALMPTASTAHLIGNNEGMEAFTSCIFARTVLSGQFMVVNKHMVKDLEEIGLWNKEISNDIILDNGSMQSLDITRYDKDPSEEVQARFEFLKKKYKTSYELPMKIQTQMALERGRFICQTQSFNCFKKNPTYQQMSSFLFDQWKGGAKTGIYYLRSNPPTSAVKIAVESQTKKSKNEIIQNYVCTDDVCIMCQ